MSSILEKIKQPVQSEKEIFFRSVLRTFAEIHDWKNWDEYRYILSDYLEDEGRWQEAALSRAEWKWNLADLAFYIPTNKAVSRLWNDTKNYYPILQYNVGELSPYVRLHLGASCLIMCYHSSSHGYKKWYYPDYDVDLHPYGYASFVLDV